MFAKNDISLSAVGLALCVLLFSGCKTEYRWTSRVPDEIRTVSVPVFENQTQSSELGPIVSQYTLREFQREGTFAIRRTGEASIEVQGVIKNVLRSPLAYDRAFGMRTSEYRYEVTALISLINKDTGKVLQENRPYTAETTFLTQGDLLTGQRNAAARIAQELARQIVDDVVSYPYNRPGSGKVEGVQK